jgi:hypothetical protein
MKARFLKEVLITSNCQSALRITSGREKRHTKVSGKEG